MLNRVAKLRKEADRLNIEAIKLQDAAEEQLRNGNELEWEELWSESIEKEKYSDGIMHTLRELGLLED